MDGELRPRTVQLLLRCVQSANELFAANATIETFRERYLDIGRRQGSRIFLSTQDKEKIRAILRSEGIDPQTPPDAWRGLSRTDALALGNNEKLTGETVKKRRVAIKALRPTLPLMLNGESLYLPARCHVEVDYETASVKGHDIAVVVENWEAFNDIHVAADRLAFPGRAGLVMWRGDNSMTRADALLEWLRRLDLPTAAFVDYDPEGLIIARGLPRMQMLVVPDEEEFVKQLATGVRERYLAQIPHCQATLDAMSDNCLEPIWKLIRQTGKALPQERFCMAPNNNASR